MPETETPPPTPPPAPTQKTTETDPAEGWKGLLAKHKDDHAAISKTLFDENHKLRGKLREARAKAAPEGSLVLTADDAKAWNEYRALGKVEDLRTAKEQFPAAMEKLAGIERRTLHDQAAAAHGLKAPVLSRLLNDEKLQVEVKKETVDGKPSQVAYVKHKDDQGKDVETKLPDYAKAHWSDFLPALSAEPDKPHLGTPPRRGEAPPPRNGEAEEKGTPTLNLTRAF